MSRRQLVQLALIVLVAVNLRPAVTTIGPLLSQIRGDLDLNGTAAGALTTVPLICFGSFGLVAPALRRRPAGESLLVASMGLLAAALLLRVVPVTAALFAGSLLAGIAISIGNIAVPAVIKRDHPERITTVTAVYSVAVTTGAAVASGVVVPFEHALDSGWRTPLALLAIPAALAGLAWLPSARVAGRPQPVPATAGAVWRSPLAWQVTVFMGTQSLLAYVVVAWVPSICQDHGMSATTAGYVIALSTLFQAVGALTVPFAVRRVADQRPLVLVLVVLSLVGFAGIGWAPIGSVWIWAVLLGFGQGVGFALALSFIGLRAASAEVAGHLSGMAQGVGYVIAALGPLAVGAVHDATGDWTVPILLTLVVAALMAIPGLAAGRLRTVGEPPAGKSDITMLVSD